jgi:hypothetical protein
MQETYESLAIELTYEEQASKVRRIVSRRLSRSLSGPRLHNAIDEVCSDVWSILVDRLSNGTLLLSGIPQDDIPMLRRYVLSQAGYAVAEYWRRVIGTESESIDELELIDYRDSERPPRYQLLTAEPGDIVATVGDRLADVALFIGWIDPYAGVEDTATVLGIGTATVKRHRAELRTKLGQSMVAMVVCEALDSLIPDHTADPMLSHIAGMYED